MRQKSSTTNSPSERLVKNIRRATQEVCGLYAEDTRKSGGFRGIRENASIHTFRAFIQGNVG